MSIKTTMKISPVASVLLGTLKLSTIVESLTTKGFQQKIPELVWDRTKGKMETLEYLVDHYKDKNHSAPYIQLVSAHRVLIEDILSAMFPSDSAPLNNKGEIYTLLNHLIISVKTIEGLNETKETIRELSPDNPKNS